MLQVKYKPQKNFLSIITMGGKNAVVSKYSLSFKGKWVWHWKNYIDKNFISKFTNLSLIEMKSDEKIPKIFLTEEVKKLNDDMRCGGCGAKAAKEILNSARKYLKYPILSLCGPIDDLKDLQNYWEEIKSQNL